jgi:chromate reductase, NAD(P)H dehydrogenase (quinone)
MAHGPILIIAGTNRPGSNTLRVARVIERHYQNASTAVELFSLEALPQEIFDPRSYAQKPQGFAPIQQKVLDTVGLHVVTPEYNGGFPGVLKYFIDMLKFPDSFEHKPVAFTGLGNGAYGALRPVEQLQHIFGYRNAYVYPERVFIPGVRAKLDDAGNVADVSLNERLMAQAMGFAKFVRALSLGTPTA